MTFQRQSKHYIQLDQPGTCKIQQQSAVFCPYHNLYQHIRGLPFSYLGRDIVHARNSACHHHLISSEWRERRLEMYVGRGGEALLAGGRSKLLSLGWVIFTLYSLT